MLSSGTPSSRCISSASAALATVSRMSRTREPGFMPRSCSSLENEETARAAAVSRVSRTKVPLPRPRLIWPSWARSASAWRTVIRLTS